MITTSLLFAVWALVAHDPSAQPPVPQPSQDEGPKTRAERTDYLETSRYDEVLTFIRQMQRLSPLVRVETYGSSERGRALPLAILHQPPISTPREAVESGHPIVFVNGNIHAGEVEGKEACLHLIRDMIARNDPLLEKVVILIGPIYNADGNELIDPKNRSRQHGPDGGVGERANASGLDLNRDFTKLAASETRALVDRILGDWDPHLFIDCHTTNGSYHGYALTYEPGLHPDTHPLLEELGRHKLLPWVSERLREQDGYETFFYGNFSAQRLERGWRTYDWRPRYGTNYVGLRNRLAVLSEAYAYLEFEKRIDVTEKFVHAILTWVADHADEVLAATAKADLETVAAARGDTPPEFGLEFEPRNLGTLPIRIEEVEYIPVEGQRRPRVERLGNYKHVEMPHFGAFQTTRSRTLPRAYAIRPGFDRAVENLLQHGVIFERLKESADTPAVVYRITELERANRSFQGHRGVRIGVAEEKRTLTLPAGTLLVRTDQPLARVIFHLLEPDSDDGLAYWGAFDAALESVTPGSHEAIFPVSRLESVPPVVSVRVLSSGS